MGGILVVGISTVDVIARPVDAFPAPGGLRFFDDLTVTTGGCAVNCSIALARLGFPCDLVTRVGTDMLGDYVVAELRRHGLGVDLVVRDPARSTSFSFVAVGASGERSFLHTTGANATITRSDVPEAALQNRDVVMVTGTMLMDTLDGPEAATLLADARALGATTILDTVLIEGTDRREWIRRVEPALPHLDYFVPSEAEGKLFSALDDPAAAAQHFQRLGANNVVIKLGERGVFYRDAHGNTGLVPAFRIDHVVDTTGAGDCWCAGFIAGLRLGMGIEAASRLGNAVAACSILAPGATAGVRSLAETEELIRRGTGGSS